MYLRTACQEAKAKVGHPLAKPGPMHLLKKMKLEADE